MDFWALVGLDQHLNYRFITPICLNGSMHGSFAVILYLRFKNRMMGYSCVIVSINTASR